MNNHGNHHLTQNSPGGIKSRMRYSCQQPEKIDRLKTLAALYDETFKNIEEGTITEGRVIDIQRDRGWWILAISLKA